MASQSYSGYQRGIRAQKDPQGYWHLHHSNCRNALNYVYTTSHTLPTCDMSLSLPIVAMSKARAFVESLLPYIT